MKLQAKTRLKASFSPRAIAKLWDMLNTVCFDGLLKKPIIVLQDEDDMQVRVEDFMHDHGIAHVDQKDRSTMGLVLWDYGKARAIILINKAIVNPRELMLVLVHEMVHQALAESEGYIAMCKIGHGTKFKAFKEQVARYKGLYLTGADFNRI